MLVATLDERRSAWRNATPANHLSLSPMGCFPPCSNSADDVDDADGWARVILFIAVDLSGSDGWASVFQKLARLHFADNLLYVVAREPLDDHLVSHLTRALGSISGGKRRGDAIKFVLADEPGREFKRVWNEKRFPNCDIDVLGNNFAVASL